MSKIRLMLGLWLLTILALGGCVAPPPRVADPAAPPADKVVIFGLYQEPEILNPLLRTQIAAIDVGGFMLEGLMDVSPEGTYIPVLIDQVPSIANGQVTPDGMQVTYRLREGLLWSDGAPFTCDDVRFTWEVAVSPDSGTVNRTGYNKVAAVDCPTPDTVVVRFGEFYAAFMDLFWAILPRHATGEVANMQEWAYNWAPVGTGPFKMQSWVNGDQMVLVKNEHYRDYPDRPHLDRVVVRIIPSREVGKALITSGEIDFLLDLTEADVPEFESNPNVTVHALPGPGTERLVLNLADPTLDGTDDPLNNPHPLLGDLRVRQAIQLGIDKQFLVDELLYGATTVGVSELSLGWARCDIAPAQFNPEMARALLDAAGFVDQDGDGVRECRGCLYAAEGAPLRLKFQTTSGNQMREESQQLILEMMADIGIQFYIENVPSAELFGSWASGAFRKHGKFDVVMYSTSDFIDPQGHMDGYFHSRNMPVEANSGAGLNFSRWINPLVDAAIVEAGATPDITTRKAAYQVVCAQVDAELPHIYLYDRAEIHLTRTRLVGYRVTPWSSQAWNAADWDVIN